MTAEFSRSPTPMIKSSQYYLVQDDSMPEWPSYTIKEASQKTGYNEEYLRRLIRQGKIEAIKVGPTYLIRVESVDKYIAEIQKSDDARTGPRDKSE